MTDRRGPQPSGEDRSDLTPEEARAEVEAFMGEGWRCIATQAITRTAQPCHRFRVCAVRSGITNQATAPTYRAAVSALKSAWRDAVRPLLNETARLAHNAGWAHREDRNDAWESNDEVVARVLKEDSNG